jgi:hypothetical protein
MDDDFKLNVIQLEIIHDKSNTIFVLPLIVDGLKYINDEKTIICESLIENKDLLNESLIENKDLVNEKQSFILPKKVHQKPLFNVLIDSFLPILRKKSEYSKLYIGIIQFRDKYDCKSDVIKIYIQKDHYQIYSKLEISNSDFSEGLRKLLSFRKFQTLHIGSPLKYYLLETNISSLKDFDKTKHLVLKKSSYDFRFIHIETIITNTLVLYNHRDAIKHILTWSQIDNIMLNSYENITLKDYFNHSYFNHSHLIEEQFEFFGLSTFKTRRLLVPISSYNDMEYIFAHSCNLTEIMLTKDLIDKFNCFKLPFRFYSEFNNKEITLNFLITKGFKYNWILKILTSIVTHVNNISNKEDLDNKNLDKEALDNSIDKIDKDYIIENICDYIHHYKTTDNESKLNHYSIWNDEILKLIILPTTIQKIYVLDSTITKTNIVYLDEDLSMVYIGNNHRFVDISFNN